MNGKYLENTQSTIHLIGDDSDLGVCGTVIFPKNPKWTNIQLYNFVWTLKIYREYIQYPLKTFIKYFINFTKLMLYLLVWPYVNFIYYNKRDEWKM